MIVDPRYFHFLAFNNHMFCVCSIYLMLQNSYGLNDHQASIKSIITFKTFSIFSCLALLKEPMWQRFWPAGLFGRAIIPHISQVQPFYLYIFRLPKYHPLEIKKSGRYGRYVCAIFPRQWYFFGRFTDMNRTALHQCANSSRTAVCLPGLLS